MGEKYDGILQKLSLKGAYFQKGMTDSEIESCESYYQIHFPLPIKELYSTALPIQFYNWRDFHPENVSLIKKILGWPLEGLLFDIENNAFWYDGWGDKPADLEVQKQVCIDKYKDVPELFPIMTHRYMPYVENEYNLPVYSVYQTDIIYYGENLKSYLEIEYGLKPHSAIDHSNIPRMEFWENLAG